MFGDGVGGASDGGDDGREEEEVGDEVSDDAVGRWRELKVGVCVLKMVLLCCISFFVDM